MNHPQISPILPWKWCFKIIPKWFPRIFWWLQGLFWPPSSPTPPSAVSALSARPETWSNQRGRRWKTWERMGQPKAQGWSIFQDKQLGRIEDCIESVVVPSFLLQTTKNIQNPTKIHMVLKITFHIKMSIQWEQDKSTCLPRKLNQPPWFEPVDAQLPRQSHLSYLCTRFGHLYPT